MFPFAASHPASLNWLLQNWCQQYHSLTSSNTSFAELSNSPDYHHDLRSKKKKKKTLTTHIKVYSELQTQQHAEDNNISTVTHHRTQHNWKWLSLGHKLQSWLIKPDTAAFQLWEQPMIKPTLMSARETATVSISLSSKHQSLRQWMAQIRQSKQNRKASGAHH